MTRLWVARVNTPLIRPCGDTFPRGGRLGECDVVEIHPAAQPQLQFCALPRDCDILKRNILDLPAMAVEPDNLDGRGVLPDDSINVLLIGVFSALATGGRSGSAPQTSNG